MQESKFDLTNVSRVVELQDDDYINDFLELGWKLINVNTKDKLSTNFETGREVEVTYTCYSVAWAVDGVKPEFPKDYEQCPSW